MSPRRLDAVALAAALATRLRQAGRDATLHVVEAGARKPAGQEDSAEPFYRLPDCRILAVEADAAEAARLAAALAGDARVAVAPYGLGRRDGPARLVVTRKPNCSSLYDPNPRLIERYPGLRVMAPEREVEIDVRALASVLDELRWPRVDLVKMDVQGAELDILAGLGAGIDEVAAIVTEVSFQEVYLGQPQVGDVLAFMAARGFEFYRFLHLGGMARRATRYDQRQQMYGDALFVRAPEAVAGDRAARLAVAATLYGMLDVAEVALESAGRGDVAAWYRERIAARPPRHLSRLPGRLLRAVRRRLGHAS